MGRLPIEWDDFQQNGEDARRKSLCPRRSALLALLELKDGKKRIPPSIRRKLGIEEVS